MFFSLKQRVERIIRKTYYGEKLEKAIQQGDLNAVKQHCKSGGDFNTYCSDDIFAPFNEGYPAYPLIVTASKYGQLEIVRFLVNAGADVNARTPHGNITALMEAAAYGKLEVAQFLLQHGADVNATDDFGRNALMCASETNNLDIIIGFKNNEDYAASIEAAKNGKKAIVKILQEYQNETVNEYQRYRR